MTRFFREEVATSGDPSGHEYSPRDSDESKESIFSGSLTMKDKTFEHPMEIHIVNGMSDKE